MLSLLARRITTSPTTSFAARLAVSAAFAPLTRTFQTTAQRLLPPAATKSKTTKESSSSKKTPKAETKKPAKAKAETVNRVSKEDLPPKRPASPYLIFYAKYRDELTKKHGNDVEKIGNAVTLAKRAGEAWTSMAQEDKQSYYNEYEVMKTQYEKNREKYFNEVDPNVLKEINKNRKSRGMSKLRNPNQTATKPLTPFMRFAVWFRSSPEGRAIMEDKSQSEKPVIRASRTAGERWRKMSDEEKYPYVVAYNRERGAA
ncbi:hypothetical protein ID866_2872 [Astraeus odoratus]|nr:hypothetical protein ID866_2872 [Astraeus odoratus]